MAAAEGEGLPSAAGLQLSLVVSALQVWRGRGGVGDADGDDDDDDVA
jgi:hypothetical protein